MESRLATWPEIESISVANLQEFDDFPFRDDIVVSLTTVPDRLTTLRPVLLGLLRQTVRGVPIEIHIADRVRSSGTTWPPLPAWLESLNAVAIIRHEVDCGPAMKYLPALDEAATMSGPGDRLVIVVDDDVIYPPDLIDGLIEADARWNGDAALCYRGWRIHPTLSWERSVLTEVGLSDDRRVGVLTGHGGYSLRARHVDLDALRTLDGVPEACWMMDDVWLSGHLSRNGTPKYLINGSGRLKIPIKSALGGERESRNDTALQLFSDDWMPDELEDA